MIPQNWQSFGPIEGEEDLAVEQAETVTEASIPVKLEETTWFGSKPTPTFVLNLGD